MEEFGGLEESTCQIMDWGIQMGVKVLKKEEDKIQLEFSGRYTLKEVLSALDFFEIDKFLSRNGLEKKVVQDLSHEINRQWWENNKEWFLK